MVICVLFFVQFNPMFKPDNPSNNNKKCNCETIDQYGHKQRFNADPRICVDLDGGTLLFGDTDCDVQ